MLIDLLDIGRYATVIEPSAGGGSFSQWIPGVLAFDIEPECDGIIQQDYLALDITDYGIDRREPILVIGNPPFGTAGSLALEFIKHSATFADTIAFILPLSFAKDSMMNKIPRNFHLNKEIGTGRGLLLDEDSFTLEGVDYSVPCVFQVWERRDELRDIVTYPKFSKYIDFVSKDVADFRIQRVGGRAGKASKGLDVSINSNYFIKIKDTCRLNVDELIDTINTLTYPTITYTVGPKSLSKGELIEQLDCVIQNKQKQLA